LLAITLMANKDIIVVGASAGGIEALQKLAAGLPRELPAAVFVVWHLSPGVKSALPEVLSRAGPLPAANPQDGDAIENGRIYVAPADHHLLLERGYVRVARGPKENRFRPAVDPLFRSAAYVYGPRVVGVVLSGALDDGTAGLWTIKLRGGTAVVQEPADASNRSMPLNALENGAVDHKLPAAQVGPLLARLAREPAAPQPLIPGRELRKIEHEVRIAEQHEALEEHVMAYGELSPYTCPQCHGVLTEIREGSIVRFRCHTGHAFSSGTLLDSTSELIEARLWDAVRTFDETVLMLNEMGAALVRAGNARAAEQFFDKAREAHERSRAIREAAMSSERLDPDSLKSEAA
jgi:two-component system, chemotaxis family, protein-glutamate methylesterase/glutaminase